MHGKAPQKRRRQVKWLTPAQQHEQALRLLRPRPGAREECEFGIRHALAVIQEAKALEKGTPIRKRDRVRLIKQLRAIQDTVRDKPGILGGILDEDGLEQIYWEHALQERLVTEPSRKPRKSRAKRLAAREAFLLLGGHLFSNTGLTEGGTWHRLAAILAGFPSVDQFDFDYVRRVYAQTYRAQQRASAAQQQV